MRPAQQPQADAAGAWQRGEPNVVRCEQCGAEMTAEEIFCGQCGAVSQAAARQFSQPRDTIAIQRIVAADREEPAAPEPTDAEPVDAESSAPVAAERPASVDPEVPARIQPSAFAEPDVEATRIVSHPRVGERFILQFSTGEGFTVHGSGLIGRNPIPEPGEYFDQLVRVIDPSRSVSKTHLEYGQESGAFWVMDRYSGNGTVVREPDAAVVRCRPGTRYRVLRGTRVEIGEQFFIVV